MNAITYLFIQYSVRFPLIFFYFSQTNVKTGKDFYKEQNFIWLNVQIFSPHHYPASNAGISWIFQNKLAK